MLIGLRAGKILNRYKMGKHFQLRIEDDSFQYQRKTANIEREQKRILMSLERLPDMRRDLRRVKQQLGMKDE